MFEASDAAIILAPLLPSRVLEISSVLRLSLDSKALAKAFAPERQI